MGTERQLKGVCQVGGERAFTSFCEEGWSAREREERDGEGLKGGE